jgi:hypothetical protein
MQIHFNTTASDYQALIAYPLEKTRFATIGWVGIRCALAERADGNERAPCLMTTGAIGPRSSGW